MRDPFPAWSGKNSRCSRRISRGGALYRKGERNSRVVPPFLESPRCLSPFQGNCFPCTASTFKARIDSHKGGTWDSPVRKPYGKPPGKASRERHRSLMHANGSVTLLLQLGRKSHVHALTRDEDCLPWGYSRSTPRSMSALERNPQVPALTPHKVLGPGIDVRGILSGLRATRMGTGLS